MTPPALVTDASAWIAIQRNEPEADRFAEAIADAHTVLIAAPTRLECFMIALRSRDLSDAEVLMSLIDAAGTQTIAFDDALLAAAQAGYARYGRGVGRGSLNFGDCFAYALAKARSLPLLYKGTNFQGTDVVAAI